jgi:hypothetical protein
MWPIMECRETARVLHNWDVQSLLSEQVSHTFTYFTKQIKYII